MTTNITVTVTPADQARHPYFYVPVEIPAGTTRLDVVMAYAKADDCIIDLGLFDPRDTLYPTVEGFRGWSGGARDRFFVATDDATPGYVHGPMPAGTWNIILGLYKLPPQGADITLTIGLDTTPRVTLPAPARTAPVRPGAGWYRGDLHCHTFHSDARGAPETLHAAARQAGLDFLAVADHNTTTQRRYFHAASSPELVFVRAVEITTATGHANAFGVDDWIDFRMTRPADAHTLARLVHAKGGLLSVNHDKPGIPWDYELPEIDCMEVWQEPWLNWNWISLERWQARLVAGLRLPAIGGSDYHQPVELQPEGPFVLARPTTVLWLEELSEDAILEAMRAGRGYVTEGPAGPHLSIRVNGLPMGSRVTDPVAADVHIRGGAGDTLVWIDAGGPFVEQQIESDDWRAEFALLDGATGFVRAEIVAAASRDRLLAEFRAALGDRPLPWGLQESDLATQPLRRALSNPIYID
jgi:predicted metal-dependent phosphoesterase TrpH